MYNTLVNVEGANKEKNEFYNEQWGMKRSGTSAGTKATSNHTRDNGKIFPTTTTQITDNISAHTLL